MLSERVAPQSEVIRAIFCGIVYVVPAPMFMLATVASHGHSEACMLTAARDD